MKRMKAKDLKICVETDCGEICQVSDKACPACTSTRFVFLSLLTENNDLTLPFLQAMSVSRANRWHNGNMNDWSALEWAGAMCGEAGEAANAAKKLKRLEDRILSINLPERDLKTVKEARLKVAEECADTILYAVLLCARVGYNLHLQSILRDVFNRKSREYGFPERI